MNKSDLLRFTSGHDVSKLARRLANESLTNDLLVSRRAKAQQCKRVSTQLFWYGALVLTIAYATGMHFLAADDMVKGNSSGASVLHFFMCAVVGAVGGAFSMILFAIVSDILEIDQAVWLLTPVAETPRCEEGLEFLEKGGALVSAWRDMALQEREQLYVYDLEIMSALCDAHTAEVARGAAHRRNQEACRKLHNVPTAVSP